VGRDRATVQTHIVIPAKAGISCRIAPSLEIPAFAGMTIKAQ